jgi:hypothetical protein
MSTQNEKTEKPGKRSLEEILRETWLDALGTLERTETELLRLGDRVREAFIGDESAAAAFTSRVKQRRTELEHRVDEGVRRALARVADPLKGEIAALQERADRLTARLDEQAQQRARRREAAATVPGAEDGRRDGVAR